MKKYILESFQGEKYLIRDYSSDNHPFSIHDIEVHRITYGEYDELTTDEIIQLMFDYLINGSTLKEI